MKKTIVVSNNIELRAPFSTQIDQFFQLLQSQRPYLRPWLPWADRYQTLEETERHLKEIQALNRGGQHRIHHIYYKDELAGSIGLTRIDKPNFTAELGFWIKDDLQGKGIIHQCGQAIISRAFDYSRIHRLEMSMVIHNIRSIRVAERLGFQREGTLRQKKYLQDQAYDIAVFSLLKNEWNPLQQKKF